MDPDLARRQAALVDRLTVQFVRSGLDPVRASQAAVELVDDPEALAQLTVLC